MTSKKSKGLEPFFVKVVALFICAFYLLGPLNKEVSNVLYTVVHLFEAPAYIISHQSKPFNSSYLNKIKNSKNKEVYQHELIDLVSDLFKNSDNKEEPSIPKIIKVDKHIAYQDYFSPDEIKFQDNKIVFFFIKVNLSKGFQKKIKAPPQTVFS